jgi:hypothetical protein
MHQIYENDSIVFAYYFDWDTITLNYDTLTVIGYDYTDGVYNNIIDEYRLLREYTITKYIFFKKIKFDFHRITGCILSNDKQLAKAKFLFKFLTFMKIDDTDMQNMSTLTKMILSAKSEYNSLIDEYPEILLKILDDDKVDEFNIKYVYWRY